MGDSTTANDLYPIVRDLTNATEYGGMCCCDGTAVLESFSLKDLAIPIVTPRNIFDTSRRSSSPTSPPRATSSCPATPSKDIKKPSLRRRCSPKTILSKSNSMWHRRYSGTGLTGQEDGGGDVGDGRGNQNRRLLLSHRRANSSPSPTTSDTVDSTTSYSCSGEAEERLVETTLESSTFHDVYVLTRQITRCNLSSVWECVHRQEGTRYCVKVIDRRRIATRIDEDAALREISILSFLGRYQNPGVVQFVETMEDHNKYYIVTKLAERGNLLNCLTRGFHHDSHQQEQYSRSARAANIHVPLPSFSEHEVKQLARSLLQGVEFLHSLGICHNNLHPENILLLEGNDVAICDFGCALYLDNDHCCRGRYGNIQYAAPEVILGHSHGTASDLWSVGVIIYHCLVGYPPFAPDDSRRRLKERIVKGEFSYAAHDSSHSTAPNSWDSISRSAKQFISNLIHVDPQVRLTASEALLHPWLASSSLSPVSTNKQRRRKSMVKRLFTMIGVKSPREKTDMDDLKTSSTLSSSFGSIVGGSPVVHHSQ